MQWVDKLTDSSLRIWRAAISLFHLTWLQWGTTVDVGTAQNHPPNPCLYLPLKNSGAPVTWETRTINPEARTQALGREDIWFADGNDTNRKKEPEVKGSTSSAEAVGLVRKGPQTRFLSLDTRRPLFATLGWKCVVDISNISLACGGYNSSSAWLGITSTGARTSIHWQTLEFGPQSKERQLQALHALLLLSWKS